MSCEYPTFELPVEAAAGEEFAQGGDHPSPLSPTPHFSQSPNQRRQGSSPAPAVVSSRGRSRPLPPPCGPQGRYGGMLGREVPPRRPSELCDRHLSPSTLVVCEHPATLRSIRCWVVPDRDSSSSAGSVRRVAPLNSSVSLRLVYTWPLLGPDGPFLLAARHSLLAMLSLAASVPPHLRWGKPRRKCSGLPGDRRSACWRSVYPPLSRCVGSPVSTPCASGTVPGFAFNGVPLFGQVSRPGSGR